MNRGLLSCLPPVGKKIKWVEGKGRGKKGKEKEGEGKGKGIEEGKGKAREREENRKGRRKNGGIGNAVERKLVAALYTPVNI